MTTETCDTHGFGCPGRAGGDHDLPEVWCARCPDTAIADFHLGGETVSLCAKHSAQQWPSELTGPIPEGELRALWGNR